MKILLIVLSLFLFGCASPPQRPSFSTMYDAVKSGMTGEQLNQIYADYDKARAEYEQSASYKITMGAVAPLLVLGGAANGLPLGAGSAGYGLYSPGGLHGPGNITINTVPTVGGGFRTTINPTY